MTSFDNIFVPLEFLRPLWLIVFFTIVIATGIRFILRTKFKPKYAKQSLIAEHLSANIVSEPSQVKRRYFSRFYLLAAIISLALSGPSFRSVKIPLHEIEKATVIVFDLSYSMYATDLKPNRLSQARYKAIDFIKQSQEGETGFIAYAGDAFVIAPLTTDAQSILNQIPHLSPEIMPVTGSRADLALNKAIELLKNSGYKDGHIIFITDGITKSISQKMIDNLKGKPWIVSVLSVATKEGAPITLPNGNLLKNSTGNIIIPKLNTEPLYLLSKAGNGLFLKATYTGNEITQLVNFYQPNKLKNEQKNRKEKLNGQGYRKDDGYWIAFILLPLFLLLFRKGIFFILLLGVTIPFIPPVHASIWHNDQQNALQAYQDKNYKLASDLYHSPLEKGCAYYKEKNYKSALAQFKRAEIAMPKNSTVLYNKGNTLAQLKQLDKAIEAYKQAIFIKPNFKQAIENKKLLEALKKKQKQQKKKPKNKGKTDDKKQNKNKSDNKQQNKKQQKKDKSDDKQQNKKQQKKGKSDDKQQNKNKSDDKQQNKNKSDNKQQNKSKSDKNQQKKNPKNKGKSDKNQKNKEQLNNTQKNKDPSIQKNAATSTNKENKAQEKMPVWMKNMPDDPSFLLKREMQLEYQKRARSQSFDPNNNNGASW